MKIIKNGYRDILNELVLKEATQFVIENACVQNGFAIIRGWVKANWEGVFNQTVLPAKYYPYVKTDGVISYISTANDNNKLQCVRIDTTGKLYIWCPIKLTMQESFQIMYPLK